jgi:hypothetical protein
VWKTFSIENAWDVLENFATHYEGPGKPYAQGQGFEIAGFVWWQGYGDQGEPAATRYRANMARFIEQIRAYYESRYPGKGAADAPFVLATLAADGGWNNPNLLSAKVAQAQLDVVNDVPNVKTIEARSFWRDASISPSGQGYHYNWNAETYLLVGDALGRAMVDLQSATTPGNTFAGWIAGYPSVPPGLAGFDQDADGDGIDNGAENFFGTNPGAGSSGLVAGASSGNTFNFTHPQNATPATGVTAVYRWSKDLATFRTGGQTDGDGTTVAFNAVTNAGITTVTATVTGTATARLFVDVKVTQN